MNNLTIRTVWMFYSPVLPPSADLTSQHVYHTYQSEDWSQLGAIIVNRNVTVKTLNQRLRCKPRPKYNPGLDGTLSQTSLPHKAHRHGEMLLQIITKLITTIFPAIIALDAFEFFSMVFRVYAAEI